MIKSFIKKLLYNFIFYFCGINIAYTISLLIIGADKARLCDINNYEVTITTSIISIIISLIIEYFYINKNSILKTILILLLINILFILSIVVININLVWGVLLFMFIFELINIFKK